MADRRQHNPADLVSHLSEMIAEERRKIAESMAAISDYAEQLRRVADDTGQRLLTKD